MTEADLLPFPRAAIASAKPRRKTKKPTRRPKIEPQKISAASLAYAALILILRSPVKPALYVLAGAGLCRWLGW